MKRNILIVFALVGLISSNYIYAKDNLNGTRIYCESSSCGFFDDYCKEIKPKFFLGYEFGKDKVLESYYRPITKKIIRTNRNLFYATSLDKIYLSPISISIDVLRDEFGDAYDRVVVIDRKESFISKELSMIYRLNYTDRTPFSCKVFNGTHGGFQNLLEGLYNNEIKEQTQGNKI
jgi:hypothetical protein